MPRSPKSGEQDDQMAPMDDAARNAMIDSGMFGTTAQMRSPAFTPAAVKARCRRATAWLSSAQLIRRRTLSSPRNTSASASSFRRSMFSA